MNTFFADSPVSVGSLDRDQGFGPVRPRGHRPAGVAPASLGRHAPSRLDAGDRRRAAAAGGVASRCPSGPSSFARRRQSRRRRRPVDSRVDDRRSRDECPPAPAPLAADARRSLANAPAQRLSWLAHCSASTQPASLVMLIQLVMQRLERPAVRPPRRRLQRRRLDAPARRRAPPHGRQPSGTPAAKPRTQRPGGVRYPSPVDRVPGHCRHWTEDRRRAVMLHELAHVARYDCLTQMLAGCRVRVYWFHPAAWWVARRLRIERELACDDRVIAAGHGSARLRRAICWRSRTRSAAIARRRWRSAWPARISSKAACSRRSTRARNRRVPAFRVRAAGAASRPRAALSGRGQADGRGAAAPDTSRRRRRLRSPLAGESGSAHSRRSSSRSENPRDAPSAPCRRRWVSRRTASRDLGNSSDDDGRHGPPAARRIQLVLRLERPARSAGRADRRAARGRRRPAVPAAARCRHVHVRRRHPQRRRRGHVLVRGRSELPGGAGETRLRAADGARAVPAGAADIGYAFVDELNKQGYAKPQTSDLVRAGQHGVQLTYLREMGALGTVSVRSSR